MGTAKRLDDDKAIEKFEDFRMFKSINRDTSKESWSACNISDF